MSQTDEFFCGNYGLSGGSEAYVMRDEMPCCRINRLPVVVSGCYVFATALRVVIPMQRAIRQS
jgi:hypothetical protein